MELLLLALLVLTARANGQINPQCPPPSDRFTTCQYIPGVNCGSDAECQTRASGGICCPDGCGSVCKNPTRLPPARVNNPQCPPPSGQITTCQFRPGVNCLSDDECHTRAFGEICCSEGCGSVCKNPIGFNPDLDTPCQPGVLPLPGTDCSRGGSPCPIGSYCDFHPADRYAVCCPGQRPGSDVDTPCQPGVLPLSGTNCGRGGSRCPFGSYCDIHPADRYAVCCPGQRPGPDVDTPCQPGVLPLPGTNCGRGGSRCPFGSYCDIHPADRYAVCCPGQRPGSETCEVNGIVYNIGDNFNIDCNRCTCRSGGFPICTLQACPQPKRGNCPVPPSPFLLRCPSIDRCTADVSCPGSQKCCNHPCGKHCGRIVKVKPGTCSPFPETSRGDCAPGTIGDRCYQDGDCPRTQKCCQGPCGNKCRGNESIGRKGVCPLPATGVHCRFWTNFPRCFSDASCRRGKKCCKTACGTECTRPVKAKSGTCPDFPRGPFDCNPGPVDECFQDRECSGNQKCCRRPCGNKCLVTTPNVQGGVCPVPKPNIRFRCQRIDRCRNDRYCRGSSRCCAHPCGRRCSKLVKEKPGTCPAFPGSPCSQAQKSDECSQDQHCPGSHKCCKQPCGFKCTSGQEGGGCNINGQQFNVGERVSGGPCNPCECGINGKKVCLAIDCGPPQCVNAERKPDQCCSTCPTGGGCNINGQQFSVGDRVSGGPCNPCECGVNGEKVCLAIDCAPPQCVDAERNPDQCCSTCPNGPNCRLPDASIMSADSSSTLPDGRVCRCTPNRPGFGFVNLNPDAVCV